MSFEIHLKLHLHSYYYDFIVQRQNLYEYGKGKSYLYIAYQHFTVQFQAKYEANTRKI